MISRIPYGDLATSYRSPPTRASAAAARYTTPSSSGPDLPGSGRSSARWAASATEVTAASFWLPRALRTAPSALIKVTTATVTMVANGSHCVAAGETTAPAIAVRMLIPPQMSGWRSAPRADPGQRGRHREQRLEQQRARPHVAEAHDDHDGQRGHPAQHCPPAGPRVPLASRWLVTP